MERFHLIKKLIEQIDDVYDIDKLTLEELDDILDLYNYKKILEERIRLKKKKQGGDFENLDDIEIEDIIKDISYKALSEVRKRNNDTKQR